MLKKVNKKNPESAPEVKEVYSGPRSILHPSLLEIRSVVLV